MRRWLELMRDREWRMAMGRKFEALTDEVFHVVRWALIVGFVAYLERIHPHPAFMALRWILSFFLFGYIASRFLLRPEIRLFGDDPGLAARAVELAFNILVCVIAFVLVLWGIDLLVDAASSYRNLR